MKCIKWLDKNLELAVMAIMLAVMSVLSFVNVIMRYFFHSALSWSDEVCCYCLALSSFFALSCAIRLGTSIRVDTFVTLLSKKVQKMLEVVCSVIMLVFLAFRQGLGPGGARLLGLCTALFALATVTAWSCYGKEALGYLTGGRGGRLYAAGAGACAFLGCVLPLSQIFLLGDAMNGLMALPNLFALFLLSREVREEVRALERPLPHSPGSLHNFLKKV